MEPWLAPSAVQAGPEVATGGAVEGELDADALTLRLDRPLEEDAPDLDVRVSINGRAPVAPVDVQGATRGSRLVRVLLAEGAGSGDAATILLGGEAFEARVATRPGALPTPRVAAGVAAADGVAYVLGGARDYDQNPALWTPLASILRVDLATGEVRTMNASLPSPRHTVAAVWDSRASAACPSGCAYAFGGVDGDGAVLEEVVRYDPSRDVATRLDARLPPAAGGWTAVWTGTRALLAGAFQPLVLAFDPGAERILHLGASPFTTPEGMGAAFDPRPTAGCPSGCAYFLGGYHESGPRMMAATGRGTTSDHTRDLILRLDAETGVVVPLRTRLPEPRGGSVAAWDANGERIILAGGGGCNAFLCAFPPDLLAFDPRSGAVERLDARMPVTTREAGGAFHEGEMVLVAGVAGSAVAGEAMREVVRVPVG